MKKFSMLFVALLFILSTLLLGTASAKEVILIEEFGTPIVFGQDYDGIYPIATTYTGNAYKYRFHILTPDQPGWMITAIRGSDGSMHTLRIVDSSDNYIVGDRCASNYWVNFHATANTHYYLETLIDMLIVNREHRYGFTVYYNEDPDGETKDEATPVQLGAQITASMDGDKDIDWFTFETGSATEYEWQCSNLNIDTSDGWAKVYLEIINSTGSTVKQKWNMLQGEEFNASLQLDPNTTYYVRVYGEYLSNKSLATTKGTYQFRIGQGPIKVNEIKLSKATATLTRTAKVLKPTLTLTAKALPEEAENKDVTWTSSDPKIAKVDSKGKVTGLKEGKATITCTANDGSGTSTSCTITVKDQKVSKITLNKKTAKLKVGKTLQLKVKKLAPADAVNQKVKWTTSNKKIATVDKNGKVTAKKAGTVTITCTATDGSKKKATCKITVK